MRAITYREIERRSSCLFTGEEEFSASDANLFNVWINQRVSEFWERFFFPDFTVVEKRTFRPAFSSSTTYAAQAEVYDVRSQLYLQALRSTAPAIFQITRAGAVATVSMDLDHSMAVGDRVTISGCVQSAYNGTFLVASIVNTTDFTVAVSGAPASPATGLPVLRVNPTGTDDAPADGYWALCASSYEADDWADATDYVVTDQVYDEAAGVFKQCHTAHTSSGDIDDTKFGVLTEFVRSIDFEQTGETAIGTPKTCYEQDPRTTENASEAKFVLLDGTIVVRGEANVVWVEFRLRVPSWSGDAWAAATTYAVDDQVWDESSGDFYVSLAAANTGNAVTDATKWDRILFPYIFRDCVPQAALASALRSDAEQEKSVTELAEANRLLKLQLDIVERQQGQSSALKVRQR